MFIANISGVFHFLEEYLLVYQKNLCLIQLILRVQLFLK